MFHRPCLALVLALFVALASASAQQSPSDTRAAQPAIPDSPAGHTFTAWLAAFNSGDRALLDAYLHKYDSSKSVEHEIHFRNMTGGFVLLQILKSEPLRLEFLVKKRNSESTATGKLEVKAGDPALVANFSLRAIPPGTPVSGISFKIDAATRNRVIDGAIANLNEFYVFPETAKKMDDAVRARQKKGECDSIADGDGFAKTLTDNFQEVSHDKHLHVDFNAARMPEMPSGPPPADAVAQYHKEMERMNCGFNKVEILEGNIGYLKFDFFADPDVCGPTAVAAMKFPRQRRRHHFLGPPHR